MNFSHAKKEYFGSAPNVFVGRYGYPKVHVGFLSNEVLPADIDAPRQWSKQNYSIPKIIDLRSMLINSRFKTNVKKFDEKLLEMTQEIAQAKNSVDVEVHLSKKPQYSLRTDPEITPYGPSVSLEKAELTENASIPRQVDKVVSDTDLKSADAMRYLYSKGYDEHFLTKLISVGNIGVKEHRKLVPTRWSITAVDDTLGKEILTGVKDYQEYNFAAHFGGYLGNYYLILFFPEVWSYELFETYVGEKGETASDYEPYQGRKNYASNTVGGYYAARLPILEYLKRKKRQASVLAFRFITDDYWLPLGVWVVRQAVRKALESKALQFSSKDLMMKYAMLLVKKRFSYDAAFLLKKSKLLRDMEQQKKLTNYRKL